MKCEVRGKRRRRAAPQKGRRVGAACRMTPFMHSLPRWFALLVAALAAGCGTAAPKDDLPADPEPLSRVLESRFLAIGCFVAKLRIDPVDESDPDTIWLAADTTTMRLLLGSENSRQPSKPGAWTTEIEGFRGTTIEGGVARRIDGRPLMRIAMTNAMEVDREVDEILGRPAARPRSFDDICRECAGMRIALRPAAGGKASLNIGTQIGTRRRSISWLGELRRPDAAIARGEDEVVVRSPSMGTGYAIDAGTGFLRWGRIETAEGARREFRVISFERVQALPTLPEPERVRITAPEGPAAEMQLGMYCLSLACALGECDAAWAQIVANGRVERLRRVVARMGAMHDEIKADAAQAARAFEQSLQRSEPDLRSRVEQEMAAFRDRVLGGTDESRPTHAELVGLVRESLELKAIEAVGPGEPLDVAAIFQRVLDGMEIE